MFEYYHVFTSELIHQFQIDGYYIKLKRVEMKYNKNMCTQLSYLKLISLQKA